jgi:hypothetical protein
MNTQQPKNGEKKPMKILRELTPEKALFLFRLMNQPRPGGAGYKMKEDDGLIGLYKKLKGDLVPVEGEVMDFKTLGTRDMILKNSEWRAAINLLENSNYQGMAHREHGENLLNEINEADDYKDKT